jgi:hypothetical protein
MQSICAVHVSVHHLLMKPNYSESKSYTGGVLISQWNKLSTAEQKVSLSKDWYLYYSFRNPETNKLVRQSIIKGGVKQCKSKEELLTILESL